MSAGGGGGTCMSAGGGGGTCMSAGPAAFSFLRHLLSLRSISL